MTLDRVDPHFGAPTMHPFGTYLAVIDMERQRTANDGSGRPAFAAADAPPLMDLPPSRRHSRLVGFLGRLAEVAHAAITIGSRGRGADTRI
jgi:hypothetical protein